MTESRKNYGDKRCISFSENNDEICNISKQIHLNLDAHKSQSL